MADSLPLIDLDQVSEGDQIGSRNYRFVQLGQPVPIQSSATTDSPYDSQNPPSHPLAVSQRFRLLFIAHSDGFYAARTKEVMASAEDIKEKGGGSSIEELSMMNLSIGKVSILALSLLDSWLAASVANQIHFFSMSALLHKEREPSFSVCLDDLSCIKDVRWSRKTEKDYVVLSSKGKLYHGFGQDSLMNVLVNVDAVEWSTKGDFVAVAIKNVLSIMSSEFKEKLNFSLSSASLIVDSIRWVRADSIVLGCFEVGDDSEQSSYLVLVITAQDKDITDASSKPAMLSFGDMFLDYRCDVLPCASGPNLFLSYLDHHELAFIANRRNLSQHVVLLGWSLEDKKSGAVVIDISNDAWCAHIDSQGNGDDNLILALSIDKASHNDGIKFILGEEETEVSPCCILLCVTIDGKLSLFHFASAAGAVDSLGVFADSDGQEDVCPQMLSDHGLSGISSEAREQNVQCSSLALEFNESNHVEPYKARGNNVGGGNNQPSPSSKNNKPNEESGFGNQDLKSLDFQTLKGDNEETFSTTEPNQDRGTQQSVTAEKPDLESEHSPFRTSNSKGPGTKGRDMCKNDTQAISEAKLFADSLSEKVSTDLFTQPVSRSIQARCNPEFQGKNVPTDPRIAALTSVKTSVDRLSSSSSSCIMDMKSSGTSDRNALQYTGALFQPPSHLKETSGPLVQISSSGRRGATMLGDLSSSSACCDSQVLLQDNIVSGKSFIPQLNEKNLTATSQPQRSNYEQRLSIQLSNVEVLAKKMDRLFEGIGGEGGFKDASITSQEGSVADLEEGLWMMSERCRMWRGMLEEHWREIQLHVDKTVQVLARKIYMEGIFQQASDNWYSDLWNCQKLTSELELKREHILEVDQELASQLVLLERHFNTVELNKFGKSGVGKKNQNAIQGGHGKPRQQSLKSIQNTMGAQLAAAEKLSECLWKQMAALSMECPATKQNVKRELFETLGLTYDGVSFNSSGNGKTSDTPRKELLITSCSVTAKEPCRRNLSTPVKSSEPQTVRRRRDSLDQKWSSSEPLKTTVKRILLQEDYGNSTSSSQVEVKEQHLKPHLPEESAPVHSGLRNAKTPVRKSIEHTLTPLSHLADGLADRGIEGMSASSSPELLQHSASTASASLNGARENYTLSGKFGSSSSLGFSDPRIKVVSTRSFPALLQQSATASYSLNGGRENHPLSGKFRSSSPLGKTLESFSGSDARHVQQSEVLLPDSMFVTERIPAVSMTSFKNSIEIPNFINEELRPSRSAIREVKQTSLTSESFASDSKSSYKASVSLAPITSSLGSFGKDLNTEISSSKDHPGGLMLSSLVVQPNSSATSQVNLSITSSSLSENFSSSYHTKIDIDQKVSQSHLLFSSSSTSPSTLSFSPTKKDRFSSTTPTSINESSESLESGSQPILSVIGSNEDGNSMLQAMMLNRSSTTGEVLKTEASVPQPGLPAGTSGSSIEPEIPTTSITKLPAILNSENLLNIHSVSNPALEMLPNAKLEQPWPSGTNSAAATLFSGTSLGGKDGSSAVNNEDEMEEEAPESSLTTELALGNLEGFGIGLTPTSTVTKPNPFGVEMLNRTAAPVSSPLTMPPSGELFRPASFNFQSQLPSQPSITANNSAFPNGFSTMSTGLGPTSSGFGQPAQFGSGQQALGSVLGSFGQSRQLGASPHGNSSAPSGGFSRGLTGMPGGGFGGGFSTVASAGGGFASLGTGGGGGGGFAAAAMAGGGFAAAATAGAGFGSGGFGAFGNQGDGSFSTFASSSAAGRPPSQLFTQMRK